MKVDKRCYNDCIALCMMDGHTWSYCEEKCKKECDKLKLLMGWP